MRVLHLTLRRKWFDLIASGEKKEEYREIKPYWAIRLCDEWYGDAPPKFKTFDVVRLKNGYGKDAPTMDVECLGIQIDHGMTIWGAEPGVEYFVIQLGEVLK